MKPSAPNLIKSISSLLPVFTSLLLSFLIATPTFASGGGDICSTPNVPSDILAAAGCGGGTPDLVSVVTNILYSIIGVLGLVSVIFVIVGGINYMTSAGDTQKTQKAKHGIIYALIGLAVCVLSFAAVNLAISFINQ